MTVEDRKMAAPTHDSLRARLARITHPGHSWCFRCGMPWARVPGHSTYYASGHACFPLCETCWARLTRAEREPYYWKLLKEWDRDLPVGEDIVQSVIAAVRQGL